ncbi:hypothetical protein V6N12_065579 [Hibiscus sabdariffa]|uniref:Uncharacterized protein n=1 Tax=Hibiscus sabdariffa TaxID=183260 RepID=A0ABR2G9C1_9ROSI
MVGGCTCVSTCSDSVSYLDFPVQEGKEKEEGRGVQCVDVSTPYCDQRVVALGKGANAVDVVREEDVPATSPSPPVLDADRDLVSVSIVEEGLDEGSICFNGPGLEGSKAEIIHIKGTRRKVRLLADVIQSVQLPGKREVRS